jgi:ABC-type nitrate/sulfonate/bicarbonate transport system ATPase subunit
MPGAALEVQLIAKRYVSLRQETRSPATIILRDVSFAIEPGEIVALFGPSGIGKTTLLRVILGLDRDFEGAVTRPPARIGVAFQEPRLAPWLTVADNLRLVAPRLSELMIADALVEFALPAEVAKLRPRALSLGMARRVALARAFAVEPEWLVLDEPFASLDPALGTRLAGVVAHRARELGAGVLLATHSVPQTLAIADRVLVLAGQPATLAADLEVLPGQQDAVQRVLLSRFPFLAAALTSEPPAYREDVL